MAPRLETIRTAIHGRYLVDAPAAGAPAPLLIGFHGYAETAAVHAEVLARLDPAHRWTRVSVQGLHRFYTRAQDVVASWMTREDRDLAIADNLAYAEAVRAAVTSAHGARPACVMVGFSQGTAQAYRAGLAAGEACLGIVALGGDLPPDVAVRAGRLPPVLIGRGLDDGWYTADKAAADVRALHAAGAVHAMCEFDGGHEWAEAFVAAAASWIEARRPR